MTHLSRRAVLGAVALATTHVVRAQQAPAVIPYW
jgi:hypothetical protein